MFDIASEFHMLPTDKRLGELSLFQELWISGHIMKRKREDYELELEHVKLLCSFIDPVRAKRAFTEGEKSENAGFLADLARLDPNFDPKQYADVLDE